MRSVLVGLLVVASVLVVRDAAAIRPFITDDARVVGEGHLQLETWWRRDRRSLQHWAIAAFGPNDHIELSLGGVHGVARTPRGGEYAISGPLAQGKFLLSPAIKNRWPGIALAAGAEPPVGKGGFEVPGWSAFAYVAATESLFDDELLLVHANAGFLAVDATGYTPLRATWGIGTQLRTVAQFHLIGEIFSGDPYVPGSGGAVQYGFRYIFNDHLQLDGTMGTGLWGAQVMPTWFSSGFRIVSHELF